MIKLDILEGKMKEKGLSVYKLIKLTGLKKSTLYSYFNGRSPVTKEVCGILADAINVDVLKLFPDLADEDDVTIEDIKEAPKNRPLITIEDMTTDGATLVPEDGYTVKARMVVDHLGTKLNALAVQSETQVLVATGIKADNVDMDRLIVHGLTRHIIENECHVLHTPIKQNGELCIVLYVHSHPLMVCRGKEIAQLMYV